MNNFLKHIFMSIIGGLMAYIVVIIVSTIVNVPANDAVGWIALFMAGSFGITKLDRY
jgi:hypothetical protein